MLVSRVVHLSVLVIFVTIYAGCQRGARQVVFENPCANQKDSASAKNCNKPTSTSGGTGTGSDDWVPTTSNDSQSPSPTSGPNSTPNSTSNNGNSNKPPTSGTGGGGSGGPIGGGGGGAPNGPIGGTNSGNNNSSGNNSSGNNNTGSGGNSGGNNNLGGGNPPASSDFTATTKLGISISKQGVPSLIFNGANQAKFSEMQYSSEALSFVIPEAGLAMQGQGHTVGQLDLKISLTFKYESKSCTGTAVAKIDQESAVSVKCQ